MTDMDFYVYLYAHHGLGYAGASFAISTPANASRAMLPQSRETVVKTKNAPSDDARDTTEQPEVRDELLDSPRLGLKFSDGAKTEHGLVMGWAPDCDIVLPKKKGISRYHSSLTFDKKNRLIVRDLGSLWGTSIIYDGEVAERGFGIDWIIGGVEFVRDKKLVLDIVEECQFRIVVPSQDHQSQQYLDKVKRFHQGRADTADLLACLRTRSLPATEAPTPTGTSRTSLKPSRPVLWTEKLGEGAYGIVTRVFNVSTGDEYVRKEPKNKSESGYNLKNWKREADIMSCVQHVSINLA